MTTAATGKAEEKVVEKPAEGQKPPADTKTAEQKAADQKTADDAAAAAKATEDAAAKKATDDAAAAAAKKAGEDKGGPPDKYALTLPEGGRISTTDLTAIEAIARAEGWTNEETQARLEQHAEMLEAQHESFSAALQADPDYGGDKLEETTKHALLAMDRLRPKGTKSGDALREMLTRTGYGDHPLWVGLMADIGRTMAEDGHHQGGSGETPREKQPIEERIYRDKPKK